MFFTDVGQKQLFMGKKSMRLKKQEITRSPQVFIKTAVKSEISFCFIDRGGAKGAALTTFDRQGELNPLERYNS